MEKLNIENGWNLVGIGKNISVTDLSDLGNINTVWKWNNGNWTIWSPKSTIMNLIKNYGLSSITEINAGEGFWVNK